jgi:hypothetical protein
MPKSPKQQRLGAFFMSQNVRRDPRTSGQLCRNFRSNAIAACDRRPSYCPSTTKAPVDRSISEAPSQVGKPTARPLERIQESTGRVLRKGSARLPTSRA